MVVCSLQEKNRLGFNSNIGKTYTNSYVQRQNANIVETDYLVNSKWSNNEYWYFESINTCDRDTAHCSRKHYFTLKRLTSNISEVIQELSSKMYFLPYKKILYDLNIFKYMDIVLSRNRERQVSGGISVTDFNHYLKEFFGPISSIAQCNILTYCLE